MTPTHSHNSKADKAIRAAKLGSLYANAPDFMELAAKAGLSNYAAVAMAERVHLAMSKDFGQPLGDFNLP